jgi:hypothetical protein
MQNPRAYKAFSLAGGNRARIKECIASALGLGNQMEGEERGVSVRGQGTTTSGAERVLIERVSKVLDARAQPGMRASENSNSECVDVFLKISVQTRAKGIEWWTQSEKWIETRLNIAFQEAGLPECVLTVKNCHTSLERHAAINSTGTTGFHQTNDGVGGEGRYERLQDMEREMIKEDVEIVVEEVGMWRDELSALRRQQQLLQDKMNQMTGLGVKAGMRGIRTRRGR